MADGVEQNLGVEPLEQRSRVILLVPFVRGVGTRGTLIRSRSGDRADELMNVEARLDELRRQGVEQFGIGGRVREPRVIDRLDQTAAKEMCPGAIHDVAREEGILRRSHPLGEQLAAVPFRRFFWRWFTQRVSEHGLVSSWMFRSPGVASDQHLALRSWFERDLREERFHAKVISLAPAIERMMVALRALDARAEQHLRDRRGLLAGLLDRFEDVAGRLISQQSFGRQQFASEAVEWLVGREAVTHPAVVGVCSGMSQRRAFDSQQVRPFQRPIVGVLRPLEQLVDQSCSAFGLFVIEKFADFLRLGQCADDVEEGSAEEVFVGAEFARLDIELGKFVFNERVDEVAVGQVFNLPALRGYRTG